MLNRILVSHELSESFELAYNLGYSKYFEQDNGLVVYSLVVAKSFGNLGAFVEIFGDSYSNWDLGITYLIKDNLQADISYGQGINNELSYLSIGAAWNFSLNQINKLFSVKLSQFSVCCISSKIIFNSFAVITLADSKSPSL